MKKNVSFGNKIRDCQQLSIGEGEPIRILANVGHMGMGSSIEDEKEKVKVAIKYGIDIIADNSITEFAYEFRKWIVDNYSVKLNTVPIYECFGLMKENNFKTSTLIRVIEKHIKAGADMIVVHPGLTKNILEELNDSSRLIPITSRGGAQLFWYIKKYGYENPYYHCWQEICDLLKDTGVALAIGLSLRSGSINDQLDHLYLKEMDIVGELIHTAVDNNIPVVVEGVGHVTLQSIPKLLCEIKKRCGGVPIKTLGPLASDRSCGLDHINALISSVVAVLNGASIIGTLFRSEHLGLPNIRDFEESLVNYQLLKYLFDLPHDKKSLELEVLMSKSRMSRNWENMFGVSLYPDLARKIFLEHNKDTLENEKICSMCGNRCALKLINI